MKLNECIYSKIESYKFLIECHESPTSSKAILVTVKGEEEARDFFKHKIS